MKPLVVFDIETTGLDKFGQDRIIQFAALKIDRDAATPRIIDTINEYIKPDINYTMSIAAYLKHHIHPDMLVDKPLFKDVAQKIYDFMDGCDIMTYNGANFDLPFLHTEFKRAGIEWHPTELTHYDIYQEENARHSNKLTDAFERYCGATMEEKGLSAHDAFSDIKACYAVYRHQMETAEVKPTTMLTDDNQLMEVEYNGEKKLAFNFGKYREVPLDILLVVDRQYLQWVLGTNMCNQTKKIISDLLNNQTKVS